MNALKHLLGRKGLAILFLILPFLFAFWFVFFSDNTYAIKRSTSAVIEGPGVSVPSRIAMGIGEKEKTLESPVYKAEFGFNAIAPHWKEKITSGSSRMVFVRTSMDNVIWSEWLEVNVDGPLKENDPHPDEVFPETPIFVEGNYYQYKVNLRRISTLALTPQISDLKVTYLDSRKPKKAQVIDDIRGFFKTSANHNSKRVISRAEWGSPDPYGYMFRDNQPEFWFPKPFSVNQVFIHHTVHKNDNADPAAVVRGIWEYHTYTRGWNDIGYNYLVDSNGTVYEGRYGGDHVQGAHVSDFNSGSMGVAMIGCYDSGSTCSALNGSNTSPSPAAIDGLTSLLAEKLTMHEIDPLGYGPFCNKSCLDFHKIAGHRDGQQTSCPGGNLYGALPSIRQLTKQKMDLKMFGHSAKLLSYSTISLIGMNTRTITLEFKNTGTVTWNGETMLSTANPNNRTSRFAAPGWLSPSVPAKLNEDSVPPGGIGSFTFTIKRFSDNDFGLYSESFRLVFSDGSYTSSFYPLNIQTDYYNSQHLIDNFTTIYAPQGDYIFVPIKFKNTGRTPWYDDVSYTSGPAGTRPVHLATNNPINRGSWFLNKWGGGRNRYAGVFSKVYKTDGNLYATNPHIVMPGETAHYNLWMEVPANLSPGLYREYLKPIVEGGDLMGSSTGYIDINVEPARYESQFKTHSSYPSPANDSIPVGAWIEYKNISNVPWYDSIGRSNAPSATRPVHLSTSRPLNRSSQVGATWGGDRNRPAKLFDIVYKADGSAYSTNPHIVKPGESVRFAFDVSVPLNVSSTSLQEFFQPIVEGGSPMNDPGTFLNVNVKLYSAAFAGQCAYPTISAGGSVECFFKFKNTGNVAWYDQTGLSGAPDGTKPFRLATDGPINRSSIFGSTWGGDQNRASFDFFKVYQSDGVTEVPGAHKADPGQIVMMKFTLTAPSDADRMKYKEAFKPIIEGGSMIVGGGVFINVTVID